MGAPAMAKVEIWYRKPYPKKKSTRELVPRCLFFVVGTAGFELATP
jgi:hypothetical protein